MTATPETWTYKDKPSVPGWYAISYCWDAQEGIFPGNNWWDGAKWQKEYPVIAYAGPLESKETADQWAYDHTPARSSATRSSTVANRRDVEAGRGSGVGSAGEGGCGGTEGPSEKGAGHARNGHGRWPVVKAA